jgi:hypothetical protein
LLGFPTKCEHEKQNALAQNSSSAEQRMNTRISESAAAAVWWFQLIMIILFRPRREYPELQKTTASHEKDDRGPEITDLALQNRTDSGREERLGIENVKAPAPHTSGRQIQTRQMAVFPYNQDKTETTTKEIQANLQPQDTDLNAKKKQD